MQKEIVISLFGSSSVGKSSLLERHKPVCPFCSFHQALKHLKETKIIENEKENDEENEEENEMKAKVIKKR